MESLSEYKGSRVQITSDQAGKVMFFKGIFLDFDKDFVKIKDDKLGPILVAISSIERIETIDGSMEENKDELDKNNADGTERNR